jgi:hypothetical protein
MKGRPLQSAEGRLKHDDDMARITLRLPRDVADWLTAYSRKNLSSMNYEIVAALRQQMKAEQQTKPLPSGAVEVELSEESIRKLADAICQRSSVSREAA